MNGAARFLFRFFGPRRRRFTFRWMTLATVLLIMGKAPAASQGVRLAFYYVLVLVLHEALHWFIAGRLFPGLEREVVLAPLGGPASIPPQSSIKTVAAALTPAVIFGGAAAGMLFSGQASETHRPFFEVLLVISAVNLLPFFPMDGHVWLAGIIRRTSIYWRRPAWREYLSAAGGVGVAVAGALIDPYDLGVILLPGGASIVLENLYMLRLRNRAVRNGPTGTPHAGRVEPDDKHRLDEILEKISKDGMTALSMEEEEFLQSMSGRFRQRP